MQHTMGDKSTEEYTQCAMCVVFCVSVPHLVLRFGMSFSSLDLMLQWCLILLFALHQHLFLQKLSRKLEMRAHMGTNFYKGIKILLSYTLPSKSDLENPSGYFSCRFLFLPIYKILKTTSNSPYFMPRKLAATHSSIFL